MPYSINFTLRNCGSQEYLESLIDLVKIATKGPETYYVEYDGSIHNHYLRITTVLGSPATPNFKSPRWDATTIKKIIEHQLFVGLQAGSWREGNAMIIVIKQELGT